MNIYSSKCNTYRKNESELYKVQRVFLISNHLEELISTVTGFPLLSPTLTDLHRYS